MVLQYETKGCDIQYSLVCAVPLLEGNDLVGGDSSFGKLRGGGGGLCLDCVLLDEPAVGRGRCDSCWRHGGYWR